MVLGSATSVACHFNRMSYFARLIHRANAATTSKQPNPQTMLEAQTNSYPCTFSEDIETLCRYGRLKEALGILCIMDERGVPVDFYTYSSLLEACANMKALSEGKQVHAHIRIKGFEQNNYLGTKLVSMYAMCGSMADARWVFDKIHRRNVFLWNAMISGYAKNNFYEQAIALYYQMQWACIQPDSFTFPCVLKVCGGLSYLEQGREIHHHIIRSGLESDVVVGNALVDMYAKCGIIDVARQVFDKISYRNVVSWNAMIAGYVQSGRAGETLKVFRQMQLEGMNPDAFTIVSVLPACSYLDNLQRGKEIHSYILRTGFDSDVYVGSALIDMYAKCRSIEVACQVFEKMCQRNVVSWTAMIAGYAQNGYANESLKFFRQMQLAAVKPNRVTAVSVLPACAHLAALQQGKEIHEYIIKCGFESDAFVGNALIDMYTKCGSIEIARQVFDKAANRDVVSWSAMIAGYGMHGQGEDALALFYQMQQAGVEPDNITFVGVLSACSHAGLVHQGWQYFNCMSKNYGIPPMVEHYACMVDLLGRAGLLDEAQEFIKKMPLEPSASVWGALLAACRIHCNLELGECVSKWLLELEPENAGNYVLLSNIYAAAGRWDGVANVRTMMKDRGLQKMPGCSWIVVKNRLHAFLVGDTAHPQSKRIHAMLETLAPEMEEAGYAPDIRFVLHDV